MVASAFCPPHTMRCPTKYTLDTSTVRVLRGGCDIMGHLEVGSASWLCPNLNEILVQHTSHSHHTIFPNLIHPTLPQIHKKCILVLWGSLMYGGCQLPLHVPRERSCDVTHCCVVFRSCHGGLLHNQGIQTLQGASVLIIAWVALSRGIWGPHYAHHCPPSLSVCTRPLEYSWARDLLTLLIA